MISIYDISSDEVINGTHMIGSTNYDYTLRKIYPLINKLDIQRKLQSSRFYRRLEDDILKGCIMPPITIAFIDSSFSSLDISAAEKYVSENVEEGFVLDGIQRLNTLHRVSVNRNLNLRRPLYINVVICKSMDNLLYRMITLNNGQKPMTIRHQIEMLASNMYDFENLEMKIKSEKSSKKGLTHAFKKDDLIKSYMAFLSGSVNIDNQKIIEEKMNELLAENIISSNITENKIDFASVMSFVKTASDDSRVLSWFRVSNNIIGFSAGVSISESLPEDIYEFKDFLNKVDSTIDSFDVSKINLGQVRRTIVKEAVSKYNKYKQLSVNQIIDSVVNLV